MSISTKTLAEFGTERVVALCSAVGMGGESHPLLQIFQRLVAPWGSQRIGTRPQYPSNIADDEAPFEFSLALSDGPPEVQVYVDVQGEPPSLRTNVQAGRALLEAVAQDLLAPLDRLREIESLFFPNEPRGRFGIWIGASLTSGVPIRLKVYLNPQVRGPEAAPELVTEAMNRLGFARAWSGIEKALSFQGSRRDELGIVCLDLSHSRSARVKIYVRHHCATVRDVETIARHADPPCIDDVSTFYSEVARSEGPFLKKPVLTELVFVERERERPSAITFEFPIGSYVPSDEVARQRIVSCMATLGIPSTHYENAVAAFATRPLSAGTGIHAHVTLRHVPKGSATIPPRAPGSSAPLDRAWTTSPVGLVPRIGIYFTSEAYPVRLGVQSDDSLT